MPNQWFNPSKQTVGYEDITVSTTAIGFTAAEISSAVAAEVWVEGDAVRFRTDGTDPTSSVGHQLDVGDVMFVDNASDLASIRFIRVTTDATLRVSYYST